MSIERLKRFADEKYTFVDESQPPWLEMRFLYQNLDKLLAVVELGKDIRNHDIYANGEEARKVLRDFFEAIGALES